jgi:hypothetical protein
MLAPSTSAIGAPLSASKIGVTNQALGPVRARLREDRGVVRELALGIILSESLSGQRWCALTALAVSVPDGLDVFGRRCETVDFLTGEKQCVCHVPDDTRISKKDSRFDLGRRTTV